MIRHDTCICSHLHANFAHSWGDAAGEKGATTITGAASSRGKDGSASDRSRGKEGSTSKVGISCSSATAPGSHIRAQVTHTTSRTYDTCTSPGAPWPSCYKSSSPYRHSCRIRGTAELAHVAKASCRFGDITGSSRSRDEHHSRCSIRCRSETRG